MRTTVDIDAAIINEVKELQTREGRSMGALISELLADALSRRKQDLPMQTFRWRSKKMNAMVDLTDKEAVYLQARL